MGFRSARFSMKSKFAYYLVEVKAQSKWEHSTLYNGGTFGPAWLFAGYPCEHHAKEISVQYDVGMKCLSTSSKKGPLIPKGHDQCRAIHNFHFGVKGESHSSD